MPFDPPTGSVRLVTLWPPDRLCPVAACGMRCLPPLLGSSPAPLQVAEALENTDHRPDVAIQLLLTAQGPPSPRRGASLLQGGRGHSGGTARPRRAAATPPVAVARPGSRRNGTPPVFSVDRQRSPSRPTLAPSRPTLGQAKGLKVGGKKQRAAPAPWEALQPAAPPILQRHPLPPPPPPPDEGPAKPPP